MDLAGGFWFLVLESWEDVDNVLLESTNATDWEILGLKL